MQVKNNMGSDPETVYKLRIRNLVHRLPLHEVQQEYLKNMFLFLFMFRKHLGHKPYVCKPCNKNFSQFKSLRLVAASKGQCHEKSMAFYHLKCCFRQKACPEDQGKRSNF